MKTIYKNSFLLDTHIWIWLINGEEKNINKKVYKIINNYLKEDINNKLFISSINIWEVALLYSKNRVMSDIEDLTIEDWIDQALTHPRIEILNLTKEILTHSVNLPLGKSQKKVHKDPADRMIISTAMQHNLTLITSDKKIIEYGKRGFVKILENKKGK